MGMTRATGGPVRCPWCARPVSDGPGSPEACPSCGVPLSPSIVRSRHPSAASQGPRRRRVRKSQRLRAVATVLALTAVMLVISAIGVAAALLRDNGSDTAALANLRAVLKAAEAMRVDGGDFTGVTPTALMARVPTVSVVDAQVPSGRAATVSMTLAGTGSSVAGWYGAVRSRTGRCYIAGTVNGTQEMAAVLPVSSNCTGDAARAVLMPLSPDAMVPAPSSSVPTSG